MSSILQTTGSFLLGRSPSFLDGSLKAQIIKDRAPQLGEIFFEGYLFRRPETTLGAAFVGWVRYFAILHQGKITLHSSWIGLRDNIPPKELIIIDANTKLEKVPLGTFNKKQFVFSLNGSLFFECETSDQLTQWFYMINLEILKQQSGGSRHDLNPPLARARFFEGLLFKLSPDASSWEERHFELEGTTGDLTIRSNHGGRRQAYLSLETARVLPSVTIAKGIPSPYFFQIHGFEKLDNGKFVKRIYDVASPTKFEYLWWLKALRVWIGVKKPPLEIAAGLNDGGGFFQPGNRTSVDNAPNFEFSPIPNNNKKDVENQALDNVSSVTAYQQTTEDVYDSPEEEEEEKVVVVVDGNSKRYGSDDDVEV